MSIPQPTPYPALNGLLYELVSSVKAILGENFTGAYLQGSLAIGDFDEHSDIDFLVVTEDEITESELTALQSMHARIHALGGRYPPDCPVRTRVLRPDHWETSLEGSYIPKQMLERFDAFREPLWYLDNGSRILERSGHCNTLVVRWTVRECGVPLSGPDPKSLMAPIPAEALRMEILATMRLIANSINDPYYRSRFGQPFAVMTFCRMLQSLETGRIHSKQEAVVWGLERLAPEWADLIRRAWKLRGHGHVSEPGDEEEFMRTLEFIAYALQETEGLLC